MAEPPALNWEVRRLTVDLNEGIDVGDINGDGRLDVAAGRNWYANPDWTPRPLRAIADWNGYVESNGDFLWDINGDGRLDVFAIPFMKPELSWYENPGPVALDHGELWPVHLLADTKYVQNETELTFDFDQDGVPEWLVNSWNKKNPVVLWRFVAGATPPAVEPFILNAEGNGHGMGIGDLNGDGRADLFGENGWWEQPAGGPFAGPWQFRRQWDNLHASIPCVVHDVNGDGRNDVIWGRGHDYGLYWWEMQAPTADGSLVWTEHEVDRSFSQPHALHAADLDGDGQPEIITGKRVRAHNGKDPGGTEPGCLYYYQIDSRGQFIRHDIDTSGYVGIGLQIRTADLDGDRRLDIAVAGKSGTYLLFNRGAE